MKDILIVGAGGMGRETAWMIERINQQTPRWHLLGFLDDNPAIAGREINGYKVLGGCEKTAEYPDACVVCAIADPVIRRGIIEKLKTVQSNVRFATLVDPSVAISEFVQIGEGTIICPNTVVTVNITIGEHVIINYGCTVGHDACLKDYVTIYPGANISGNTKLNVGCQMGTGSQILQGKSIGQYAFVGAGAVVVRDIPENCTAVGCPARPIKERL